MISLYKYIKEAEAEEDEKDPEEKDNLDMTEDDIKDKQEKEDKEDDENMDKYVRRGNIKFTIWEEPKKKVNWLYDNEKYQKIEYSYRDKEKGIEIQFLLGYVPEEKTWKLWIGKIGAVSYDDDPWCSFDTSDFKEAVVKSLDKVEEFMDDVEEDPENWVQFYKLK